MSELLSSIWGATVELNLDEQNKSIANKTNTQHRLLGCRGLMAIWAVAVGFFLIMLCSGLWPLDPGIASLASGVWPLVPWALEAVLWPLAFCLWPLAFRLDLFCSTAIRFRARMFVRCFRARMFVRCFALIAR